VSGEAEAAFTTSANDRDLTAVGAAIFTSAEPVPGTGTRTGTAPPDAAGSDVADLAAFSTSAKDLFFQQSGWDIPYRYRRCTCVCVNGLRDEDEDKRLAHSLSARAKESLSHVRVASAHDRVGTVITQDQRPRRRIDYTGHSAQEWPFRARWPLSSVLPAEQRRTACDPPYLSLPPAPTPVRRLLSNRMPARRRPLPIDCLSRRPSVKRTAQRNRVSTALSIPRLLRHRHRANARPDESQNRTSPAIATPYQ
jgi:hypothetical protein